MSVNGDLTTMPLPELLQWLGGNQKSGILEIERNKLCKRLVFQSGRVIACSSNDPKELFGHFLVSRGLISEELLRISLTQQGKSGKPLGTTLVEMGIMSSEELIRNLSAQAEETIFSLFDWEDAVFRFEAREIDEDPMFPVSIRVEDILLRGVKRLDEIKRIRSVFNDHGIVPVRTGKLPPPEVFRNKTARQIYESIDGDRTVADVLLNAHGSHYVVTKFLFELHRTGLIKIKEVKEIPAETFPDMDDMLQDLPAADMQQAAPEPATRTEQPLEMVGTQAQPTLPKAEPHLEQEIVKASELMNQGKFDVALEILDRLYREHPNNQSLRLLTSEAESAFIDKAYKHYLPGTRIPLLLKELSALETEDISPEEFFILSRIDGNWDIRSIIQIAPIREVEALMVLKRMLDRGVIELKDSADRPVR